MLRWTGRICAVISAFFLMSADPSLATHGRDPRMSFEEARGLVEEAMKAHHPGAVLEFIPGLSTPDFYRFEALSHSQVASPVVGFFAVDTRTGEVWDVAGFCKRVTSPSLEALQQRIRKRFEISPEQYERLRSQKPVCDADW